MLFFPPDIAMNDEEFRLLRDFVYQHCGLHFNEDSRYLLEKRLNKRLAHHQLKSFKDYYYLLRYNPNKEHELNEVVDALTTNETYFFREEFQLKTFTQEILPEIRKRKESQGERRLRIWSAGCSTGEEPYTIAMLMLELPFLQNWQIDIIGTDISQKVLQVARKGVYGNSSFRSTDPVYQQRYFTEVDGKFRIADKVKNLVTISHLNLFDAPRVALLGKMDIVFCRNVIIYFDPAGKKRVVESFYQRLQPEGFLLLGHSESLMNITNAFALRHFAHDMVYQRPVMLAPPGGAP
ncbi:MAG: chemotaxis protein CheR [Desulfuromonadales bacterium GWD2_61_12]|nr:MAG: chemotaxis protein CheR [Desulfuromonadales bacterium GWC2_61_20]OGR33727.1 MAG: chemotaxis protein CheR [Desulfuromonadales bacterium GWD2_61_12]HAD05391.1 chemotaxis protein CheR [Desulfuromonas sp.]HBT81871.1 chemotaxis protein CheR [Desulfuromonas sp.]